MDDNADPVACTLTTAEAARRRLDWAELRSAALSVSRTTRGAEMLLPHGLLADVERLVALERQCCRFLTIDTSAVADGVRLRLTSADPDALPVIEAIVGPARP